MTDRRPVAARILSMLDLTNLDDSCTDDKVVELCRRALTAHGHVAAVCVWPRFVTLAKHELKCSGVKVATVVNFPHGGTDIDEVVTLTKSALADGADEIDVVAPYRSLMAGDTDSYCALLRAVREAVVAPAHLKVILETGELVESDLIDRASRLAIECGADFIKTSTGKTRVSATVEAAAIMLRVIRDTDRRVGIKPSGGIRTVVDAARYLELAEAIMGPAWATPERFRFGASGLLDSVEHELA